MNSATESQNKKVSFVICDPDLLKCTIFIHINAPGRCIFKSRGGYYYILKKINSRVQWQWAIMDTYSLHLACQHVQIAKEIKISETNLKSAEIINFYLVFLQILMHL